MRVSKHEAASILREAASGRSSGEADQGRRMLLVEADAKALLRGAALQFLKA